MTNYVLYSIWVLVPTAFYLMALWSYLEQSNQVRKGKKRSQEPQDLLKQAGFLTIASLVTFILDTFIIEAGTVEFLFGEWTPKFLVRLFLYPGILYLGAVTIGETKRPSINKLPRPSEKYRQRK